MSFVKFIWDKLFLLKEESLITEESLKEVYETLSTIVKEQDTINVIEMLDYIKLKINYILENDLIVSDETLDLYFNLVLLESLIHLYITEGSK